MNKHLYVSTVKLLYNGQNIRSDVKIFKSSFRSYTCFIYNTSKVMLGKIIFGKNLFFY